MEKPNEDAIAVHIGNGTAIIVDGLTSKAEKSFLNLNGQSDVSWVAQQMALTFNRFAAQSNDPIEILNNISAHIRNEFDAITTDKPKMMCEYPMAAIAMLRVRGDMIELTNVGDTEIGILTKDKQVFWLHKDAGHAQSEVEREPLKEQLKAQGITNKAELRKHVLPFMQQQYNDSVNKDGGFGMFSLDRALRPQDARHMTISRNQVDQIFMATDGLTVYFDPYRYSQYKDLNHVLSAAEPLKNMLTSVRLREQQAGEAANTTTFKTSDDATGLILQF